MGNCKNLREDNDLFPYEYGVSRYENMHEPIFSLIRRKELSPKIYLIQKHMLDNGVIFSSPGGSFNRKFLVLLSDYMNYRIRYPRHAEVLKNDDKLRQLLEPLAKIICAEKSIFEEWVKKNPNGFGEYSYPNGNTYVGEWKEGKYNGQGILSSSRSLIYEGEWKNGKRHGQGTNMTKDDKHGYNGEWKDDRYHGQGTNFWEQDDHELKYEGEWKSGDKQGLGKLKISWFEKSNLAFSVYAGEFKDGSIWNGSRINKDGNVVANYVDGEEDIILVEDETENEKIMQQLDDFNLDGESLFNEYPPIWNDDNKLIVFEIAKSSGYPFNGEISYRRWAQFELPKSLDDRDLNFSVHTGVFKYPEQKDPKIVDWHLNFADPDLFVAYGSELLAQDEIQVAEHPILGSIREMLVSKNRFAETLDDDGNPTPITITGVQRRCVIDTQPNPNIGCPDGIYGNAFEIATKEQVRASTRTISPPTISNILAISAPYGGSGDYTLGDMLKVLNTAYTGFFCARKESEKLVPENTQTLIHTGFWGCGAFGGNRQLMTILQCIAADLARVDLEFWAVNNSGVEVAEESYSLYKSFRDDKAVYSFNLDFLLDRLEAFKFQWGESDGN